MMARKGDIEIELPWWFALGLAAGSYWLYKRYVASPQSAPVYSPLGPWGPSPLSGYPSLRAPRQLPPE